MQHAEPEPRWGIVEWAMGAATAILWGIVALGAPARADYLPTTEIVIEACLRAEPAACKPVSLVYFTEEGVMQCLFKAPVEIAKWNEAHPKWFAKKWTCRLGGGEANL